MKQSKNNKNNLEGTIFLQISEAATGGVLWEKVFVEILQNSQENFTAFLWILQNF